MQSEYMAHCLGELVWRKPGRGCWECEVVIYEYDATRFILGRRYLAVTGQDIVECVVGADLQKLVHLGNKMVFRD